MPLTVTLKVAALGAVAVCAAGCTVRLGVTTAAVTVSCTAELLTLMLEAVTTTR